MSDPVFLRNAISSTIYAEQINSAQIQGQQAARERATRARQEALQHESAAVKRLEEAAKSDIQERESDRKQQQLAEQGSHHAGDQEGEETFSDEEGGVLHHIDLTA